MTKHIQSVSHWTGKILDEMEAEHQDDNNTHPHAGISVSCQAFPATTSKRIQARISPPMRNQGVSIA